MVVRFLVAVSLLLALAALPSLWCTSPAASAADPAVTVAVSRPENDAPERDDFEAALSGDDPASALRAAFAAVLRGREADVLRLEPYYPARLLRDVAARRLDRLHALAGMVLLRLGDAARTAALELSQQGSEAEREVACQTLVLLGPAGPLAAWRPRPRMEW